ncbi:MAG: hypothetical protein IMZ54_11205 [Acidobacteria bacterium]|nr:hypothetical protein [Acidobacteriota bacterium]
MKKMTEENVKAALAGEFFEIGEMYPSYIAVAQAQGEKTAEKFFNFHVGP